MQEPPGLPGPKGPAGLPGPKGPNGNDGIIPGDDGKQGEEVSLEGVTL